MSEILGRLGGPRDDGLDTKDAQGMAGASGPSVGRWLRRHHALGVYALTTVHGKAYRATTVTGVLDASLDPPILLVSLEDGSQMEGWIRDSGVLGLSILAVRHQFLADRFAGLAPLAPPRFEGIDHFAGSTGCPLLSDSIGWADCRVVDSIVAGDHVNFLAQVVEAGPGSARDEEPLISYDGRYARMR